MVTAAALNAVVLLWCYSGAVNGLVFRVSTARWQNNHFPIVQRQQRHHRLSRLGGRETSLAASDRSSDDSSGSGERSRKKESSSGEKSSNDATPGGFGSRASRRSRIGTCLEHRLLNCTALVMFSVDACGNVACVECDLDEHQDHSWRCAHEDSVPSVPTQTVDIWKREVLLSGTSKMLLCTILSRGFVVRGCPRPWHLAGRERQSSQERCHFNFERLREHSCLMSVSSDRLLPMMMAATGIRTGAPQTQVHEDSYQQGFAARNTPQDSGVSTVV